MSDLISRSVLLNDMQKELEKAVNSEDMTEFECKVLMTSALALKGFVNRQPTIEANSIDEVLKVVKGMYHNFCGYDLEYMTKYGNKTAEQQHQSYSSLMMYEIAMEFDDLIDRLESMKGGEE